MDIPIQPYIKIIVIQISDFSSSIVDEHNFGINDRTEISDFKDMYNISGHVCIEVKID
jgi:hypothetical protein